MIRHIGLVVLAALLAMPLLNAASPPGSQNFLSCSALFSNNINGKPLVSPAIAAYSTYSGLIAVAVTVVAFMFVVVGLIYGLGIAFRWDLLKNFARTEYIEGFVSLLIIFFIAGGIAALNGSVAFLGNLFAQFANTAPQTTSLSLYTALCNNVFNKMVLPGAGTFLLALLNKLFISIISGLTISIAPGGFGIIIQPLYGYSLINQLLWTEQAIATFMLAIGGMLIVLFFVIYYLFPIFLFLGVALRTFPWTRAAGGAFIALFIAFYIFFPVIMYPFTVAYSSTPSPSGQEIGLCTANSNCPSVWGIVLGTFKAYLGVLTLDIGYTAYTNLLYFSEIFLYLGTDIVGLLIALLISYELVGIFGRLLGAPSLRGKGMFSKLLTTPK